MFTRDLLQWMSMGGPPTVDVDGGPHTVDQDFLLSRHEASSFDMSESFSE